MGLAKDERVEDVPRRDANHVTEITDELAFFGPGHPQIGAEGDNEVTADAV